MKWQVDATELTASHYAARQVAQFHVRIHACTVLDMNAVLFHALGEACAQAAQYPEVSGM